MKPIVFLFVIALSGANAINSNRMSNALTAAENQFPYVISLQKLNEIQSSTRGHRCGGALISLEHALTAASCTFDDNNGIISPINPAEYRVFVGSVRLTNDTSPDRTRNVSFISVHPMFNMRQPYVYDIAVITLISQFPANAVTLVRLSVPSADPFPGDQRCTVAGWGAQSISAPASTQLMYLQKTIYNLATCTTLFNNLNYTIETSMICATSGQTAASGCAGDVGNPLLCEYGGPHNILLTGLLTITKNCTASDNPEVYTRVSTFYQWILVAMTYPPPESGAASTFQPGLAMSTIFALIQVYRSCAK